MSDVTDAQRRNSGVASALEGLKPKRTSAPTPTSQAASVLDAVPTQVPESASKLEQRGPGRPPGKRSNPAYKQYSVRLRKETQRAAMEHLRREHEQPDFSELVERLVKEWAAKQSRNAS